MIRLYRQLIPLIFLVALTILVVDSLLVYRSLLTIASAHREVDESRMVLAELERSLSLLKDAETGQRGFLLTGKDEFLVPFLEAQAGLDEVMKRLQSLINDHEGERAMTAELVRVAAETMAELELTVRLQREGKHDEAIEAVQTGRGKRSMDQARGVAGRIRTEENLLLDSRDTASRSAIRWTVMTFTLTTGTALALLLGGSVLHRRESAVDKRANEKVRRSEAWLSTTLTSIGDAVIATDGEARINFMNPIAEALTGWSQAQAMGRPMVEVFSIVNETTRKTVENPVDRVIREGVIVGLANHTILIARDGTETPIDDSAAPIKDNDGNVAGVVLVFRDITERKTLEDIAEEKRRLTEFGRVVGIALTESPDLDSMVNRCVEETVRHLDGAFARIWTLEDGADVLELRASAGLYTHINGNHARVPVGQFKIGKIARERTPHLTNAVIGDPLVPAQEWASREGIVAFAGYPLIVEDRLVGVWAMFAGHELSEGTIRAMESVASGIALGIERMRASERLRTEREWLKVTLASIGDAVIATDTEGKVTFLNPIARTLTGWPEQEARGKSIEEVFRIVNERTRAPAEHPVLRVIREKIVVGLANHTILIARDGTETPIEDSAAPILDPARGMIGVVMVFRDVSEERLAKEAIEEAGNRLRFTLEATRIGQWDLDLETGETTRSRRHDQIFGHESPSSDWSFGTFIDRYVRDDHRDRVTREFHEVQESGLECDFECPIMRVDGLERWIWIRGNLYGTENGKPRRMLGLVMDITDRKQAAEELRIAKEEAENANQAKTHFLAILSHELRTPLNPILLAVSSMLDRPVGPEELQANLEMIRQNVNVQSRLIDDLLDVMRIVRGKMPLHWEVVNVHVLIASALAICRSEVSGKGLALDLSAEADLAHINADPVRLKQVVWNLVKNAVKFTPIGGSITVRTRNEASSDGQTEKLVIEVIDTGIGIEPAFLGRIFDPFQQGEISITRQFGGLGLGLAISRGIVEGHGGSLTAESPGKDRGTTFRVALDVLPEPTTEENGRISPDSRTVDTSPIKPLKILLVEDEQATRRLMARLLKGLGHEVTMAATIAEALEKEAKTSEISLIVSDIGLPDGTGLELMRQVIARRGAVPAIALTGYGMEEDIHRSREAGFTAHMTKPIDFAKLEMMIRQVVS
jgi:PAS domain S-box-containing protein